MLIEVHKNGNGYEAVCGFEVEGIINERTASFPTRIKAETFTGVMFLLSDKIGEKGALEAFDDKLGEFRKGAA